MGLKNITIITKDDIYKKVDDNSLFDYYFGSFKLNKCYTSVFRADNNPSTGFYINRNGVLIYNDISTGEKLDIFSFVAKKYMITYRDAINKIAKDFNIIGSKDYKDKGEIIVKREPIIRKDTTIDITFDKWKENELDYWKQYYITEKELNDNDVYAVRKLTINGEERPNYLAELRFAYVLEYKDKFYKKIYQPLSKEGKWRTNCPIYIPFGYNKLTYSTDTLVVCKAVKEMIILKKFFPDVIAVQNESSSSLRDITIEKLKKKYKKIYLFFDIDDPGLKAAHYYKEKGFIPVYLPLTLRETDIKDSADFVKEYGIKRYSDFLKYNNLI